MKTHLTVIQDSEGRSQAASLGNPNRVEFRWNDDFSAFQIIPLRWWDDTSYIAYQCDDEE